MKVQCPCGTKFVFEAQPEMLARPGKFVCASCGKDWSEYINGLIQQELIGGGVTAPVAASTPLGPVAPAPEIAPRPDMAPAPTLMAAPAPRPALRIPTSPTTTAPAPVAPPPPAPEPPAAPPRVRLHTGPRPAEEAAPVTDVRFCTKHPGQRPVEQCVVCKKPLCPKCMELFGFLCSPLCRQKADLQGIDVPEFAGQKGVAERKQWRKVGLMSAGIVAVLLALVGGWIWYEWVGSRPRPSFSYRFGELSYSGKSFIVGKDQIVFLHGDTLARHDMKSKKEIWSRQLVEKKDVDAQVEATIKGLKAAQDRLNTYHPDADPIKIPSPADLAQRVARSMAGALELRIAGQNIWVTSGNKLVRYDWDSGKPSQEIALDDSLGQPLSHGDEMVMLGRNDKGGRAVIHLNLTTGQKRVEEMSEPAKAAVAVAANSPKAGATKAGNTAATRTTAQIVAGSSKKLDPDKIAEAAQNAPYPNRAALPATLSAARNQERALAEMRGENDKTAASNPAATILPTDEFTLVPSVDGFSEFSVNLLEEKLVAHAAMKAKPKKSALDGNVNQAATADIANEILNDMKRDAGDDTEVEDVSRYAVAVRLPCAQNAPIWRGEVIGHPVFIPQKTVNIIAAGKSVTILDKENKKKWEATLTFPVSGGRGDYDDEDEMSYGQGPCVERGDTLYVIDHGVLSAFDLANGNARWRLPSVGIAGMFFDDEGMIYLNTTSANPDKLKYSKQIDITDKTVNVIMKLDPKTGKALWTSEVNGMINHLSGKFIYTYSSHQSYESEGGGFAMPSIGLETENYMRIKRINPKNGKVMFNYYEPRAPLDIHFDKNTINVVFKKEVEVLKFLSF